MNWTIAYTEQCHFGITVNIDVNGNKYTVGISKKETHEYYHNTFDTIEEAYEVYETLSKWIVFGLYGFDDKVKFLMTGKR